MRRANALAITTVVATLVSCSGDEQLASTGAQHPAVDGSSGGASHDASTSHDASSSGAIDGRTDSGSGGAAVGRRDGGGGAGGAAAGSGGGGIPIGGSSSVTENASGSRLVWRKWQTSYGVGLGGEWYDSLEKEACEFELSPDGKMRCLPTADWYSGGYFTDSSCKVEIGGTFNRPPCPPKFVKQRTEACGDAVAVHPVGAYMSPTQVFTGQPGSCSPQSASPSYRFFELPSEILYDDWVSATESMGASGARLEPRYLIGSDGSQERISWYDQTRGEPCRFHTASDGTPRCLPTAPALDAILMDSVIYYSDDGCKAEVWGLQPCKQPPEVKYVVRKKDECDENYRIHPYGAPATATHQWQSWNSSCQPLVPPSSGLSIGAEISATAFASAKVVEEPGTGRLRRRVLVAGDGVTEPLGLFDSARNEECDLTPSEDGSQRCLPFRHAFGAGRYADSKCATRVLEFSPSGCLYGTPVPKYAVDIDDAACPTRWVLYSVGAAVTPTTLYNIQSNGSCAPAGAPDPIAKMYELTKLSPSDFELVELMP